MKRTILYAIVFALAVLMTLPFAQMSSAAGKVTNVRHTIIAASGDGSRRWNLP